MMLSDSTSLAYLKARLEGKDAVIGVIGLGYVGLPVACEFARVGFDVLGVDVKSDRVAAINAGISPVAGDEPGLAELLRDVVAAGKLTAVSDYGRLAVADVVTVNVETPVDAHHRPNYAALQSACMSLGPVLKQGALVIVESTVAPGTVNSIVRPILEQTSGRQASRDFYLGACPERVMPGKLLHNLRSLSRVCGGDSPETAATMIALYRHIVHADLDASDIVTAELVKTVENAYRDVNIAFANEVALICETVGADVLHVRELVNKSPGRNMLLPGAGVGGHCIPKDPWLLVHAADGRTPVRLIPAGRTVNDSMPLHVANLVVQALDAAGQALATRSGKPKVAVLGYSYLQDSDDTRNSPSEVLIARLRALDMDVVVHDPWVEEYKGDVYERVRGCDAVVLMVAHSEYRRLVLSTIHTALKTPILIDGRGVFTPLEAQLAGFVYRGVGRAGTSEAVSQEVEPAHDLLQSEEIA